MSNSPSVASPSVRLSAQGPWGRLESYATYLEAPDALLDLLSLPSEQTVWNFRGSTRTEILELLRNAGLDSAQLDTLSQSRLWSFQGEQARLFPPPEIVESLNPTSRTRLYRHLSQWPENHFHREPTVFDRGDLFEVLNRSGLPDALIAQIKRLVYEDGGLTLFSDLPLLLRHLSHPRFERRLLRILTRTRTLLLRLRITAGDDPEKLARYWTAGHRHQQVLPLIRSIATTEGVERLDVAHLLPANARGQLYTYPSVSDVLLDGRAPDSLWTAINFFARQPTSLSLDSAGVTEQLRKTFQPVRPPFQFGDLLLIAAPDTRLPCHACVFIADDIVFTKHRAGFFSPWIFTELGEAISYHLRGHDRAEITAYRRHPHTSS